jgi:DNA-binding NarL/FixJ family response regulator
VSISDPTPKPQSQTSILIVDDDPGFARAAAELLADHGYRVLGSAMTADEALAESDRLRPDAILLDVRLPDGNGIALARALCAGHDAPRVLLTSSDRQAVQPEPLRESGAIGFIPKPELVRSNLIELFKR